jgi:rod shape determining protein RodA
LLAIVLALTGIGLATLYSASYDTPARFHAQLLNFAVAFAALWVAAQVPPQTLARFAPGS